ncbi:MAG: preprotein translocase subunit SecA [Bryobacterales bacterium]|nr:preprotein translocase subunit SecA [Bryobacterales bacterium]
MVDTLLAKIFGTKHEREIKRILPRIAAINELEPAMAQLDDAALAAKTAEFKQKLDNGASLDDILNEAFAAVREAGKRTVGMRHFDSQIIGGIVLHGGKIAEMKTGEGKTLVATLPVYLNALTGLGVHVVTVNDYLARRDSEWMGKIYRFMGLSVGLIVHGLDDDERRVSYGADVTYGTNNEYGFDYLRDNMKFRVEDCSQRGHNFAIVDEVDSILIDEARTPLIISGPSEESTDKYYKVNAIIPKLVRGEVIEGREPGEKYTTGDYTVEEKHRSVALTEEGVGKCERLLNIPNLYDPEYIEMNHHVQQGLRAHILYHRDKDYIISPDGEVVIVDEFTGRLMPGRRWSDGLHQAIEAKEGVKIERENQTLATVTFQNYFKLYKKLSGMTGTADTEAAEFSKIYNLDVTVVPTNRTMIRKDAHDIVYRTEEEKWRNAAKEIAEKAKTGQPVLVGTISVEKSERLSGILKRMGVRHEVLNAKNHEREAFIVAQAGRKGAVTVSTNMAGRGTDILLGGNAEFLAQEEAIKAKTVESIPREKSSTVADKDFYYFIRGEMHYRVPVARWQDYYLKYKEQCDAEHSEVVSLGGLHILGTERHESRRIDNQLRGRAGRQGDPGSSRFYLSLQDDLMRIFGGEKMQNLMLRLGMEEDVPIESGMITKRIEAAQKAVEAQNFASRKHVKEYDDVMDKQRHAVYGLRRQLLERADMKERIMEIVAGYTGGFVDTRCPENHHSDVWELIALQNDVQTQFGVRITPQELSGLSRVEIEDHIVERLKKRYEEKESVVGGEIMRDTERMVMLSIIDQQWKDHLLSMDHLKEGIGMRAYGQKDPLVEYKKEAYTLFEELMDRIDDETIRFLYFLQPVEGMNPAAPMADETWPRDEPEPEPVAVSSREKKEAQASMVNLAQNIQRKKEREMDALQFVSGGAAASTTAQPVVKGASKVGRNDPCPCGSGKKYKKCCGA